MNAEQVLKNKIDIEGGRLTFGQRIELGRIFQDTTTTEVEKFEKTFMCLHQYMPEVNDYKKLINYFQEIIDGLTYWITQEGEKLKYDPTPEEVSAGIKDLSAKIGEFGTIKALAKNYSRDPDEILQWEYGKVFGILYTDLEEHKYQEKYHKVLERKYKNK